jgi:hypothetical protein
MFQRLTVLYKSDKLPWVIIGYGIILRIVQYLHNRSLFLDEARDTVVGILGRSFADLLAPPPAIFTPTPPLGFFVIEKLAVQFLGDSEYALRLYPLMAGVISLFLFYYVAKQYIKPGALLVALILFATLEPLIYYSSSIRPYSSDIASALLIYTAAIYINSKRLNMLRIAFFGILGAIVIWFSSPSVFILAGVGTVFALFSLIKREWERLGSLLIIYLCWVLSFAACYFIYLDNFTNTEWFVNALKGEDAFMPFPPLSFSAFKWFITRFFGTFEETVGFSLPSIAALAFIIGCISIYSEKKERFFILISPILFTLLASSLSLYPFRHRMILFLVPLLILFIAEGAETIRDKNAHHAPLIGVVFMALLLFHPLLSANYHLIKPIEREEIKPVLQYVKEHWQDGDTLYIHYRAHPVFVYYSKKYGFDENDYIVGIYAGDKNDLWAFSVDYLRVYTADLDKLRGNKRVWILFTDTPLLRKGIDEEVFFLYYLNTIGKQLDSFKSVGAAVYLYDLSKEVSSSEGLKEDDTKRTLHWNF